MATTWTQLSTGTGPAGWYFTAADVERDGQRRIWFTWNGRTYLYNPASNTFVEQTGANNVGWRENFGVAHDSDRHIFWIGPQASFPGPFDNSCIYDPVTQQYTATENYGSSNMQQAWDHVRRRLYAFGGWTTKQLAYRPTNPQGGWVAAALGLPVQTQDGSRLTSGRAGIDSTTLKLYYVIDNANLAEYDPNTNAWTVTVTTGTKPPGDAFVCVLHEAARGIVAWMPSMDVVDPLITSVRRTYFLDINTKVWSLLLDGGASPPASSLVRWVPVYDRAGSRVLMLTSAQSFTSVWLVNLDTVPLPPVTYSVTLQTAGTGSGILALPGGGTTGSFLAGTQITPTAVPAAGSRFDGWSVPMPHTVVGPITIVGTFTLIEDTGGLDIPIGQMVPKTLPTQTGPVPYAGPFLAGGDSKDLQWTYCGDSAPVFFRNKFVIGWGDIQNSGSPDGYTYDPATNIYTRIPAVDGPGKILPNWPTDRGGLAWDRLRNRLWLHNTVPFPDRNGQSTPGGGTYSSGFLYLDMATFTWVRARDIVVDSLGGMEYDSLADRLLLFNSSVACSGNPGKLVVFNPSTLLIDSSYDLCDRPGPAWSGATGGWLAPQQPQRSQFAWDDVGRKLYLPVYQRRLDAPGNVVEEQVSLAVFDRAVNTWSLKLKAPVTSTLAKNTSMAFYIQTHWDAVSGKVLYVVNETAPTGLILQMLVYDPLINQWNDLPVTGMGTLRGATGYYHRSLNVHGICGASFAPGGQVAMYLFRLQPGQLPPDPPADSTAPTVTIDSALTGSLAGIQTVDVTATDNSGGSGMNRAELWVDGVKVLTDLAVPFSFQWDTRLHTNATHSVVAKGVDNAGNVGSSAAKSVTVSNPVADVTAPTCSVTLPTEASTVSGTVTFQSTASDNVGVHHLNYYLDGVLLNGDLTTAPYPRDYDTTGLTNGAHTLVAKAVDAAGNIGTSATRNFTVSNAPPADATAPVAAITSPIATATIVGIEPVAITATDNVAVVRTELWVDGVLVLFDDAPPFGILNWDSRLVANGNRSLVAKALDAAGNIGTSAAVVVNVQNPVVVPDTTAPVCAITNLTNGQVIGTQVLGGGPTFTLLSTATDNIAVDHVDVYVDGNKLTLPDPAPPYEHTINLLALSEGPHTFQTKAVDTSGNTGPSATITATVNNVAPTLAWTAPTPGQQVANTIALAAVYVGTLPYTRVDFLVNGSIVGTQAADPIVGSLDTTAYANGTLQISALAYRGTEQIAAATLSVIVANATPPDPAPTASITDPVDGQEVTGVEPITVVLRNATARQIKLSLDGVVVKVVDL